jgi:hypothetical protein
MKKAASAVFSAEGATKGALNRGRGDVSGQMAAMNLGADDLSIAWEARAGDTLLSSEYIALPS